MESDGAVNLLCCGVLACEDAKLQCDLTEKASEGHRALTLAQPLCCTDTQTEPGQAHCYQLFVMHPPRARWEQLRLLCGRPGARIGRARRGGRTHVRALRWQTVARLRFACITELEAQGIDSNCNHANVVHAAKTTSIITLPLEYTTPCAYIRPSDNNKIFSMRIH